MKRIALFVTALTLLNASLCYGQEIPPAPANKAVVYFTRTTSLGFAINFTYFDSTQVIGKFNGPKYIRYECDPGPHLFWARSENRDFVEADVEAGKIYFIEAIPKMGAVKAGVQLVPIDPTDEKRMSKIFKLMEKKPSESYTEEELQKETDNSQDVIARGLEKYKEEKVGGKTIAQLGKSMFYEK